MSPRDAVEKSEGIGKRLYDMYEAGPMGDRPVPDELVELLRKLEAAKAEEEKKQDG